eukprot:7508129-Alexandrium_andersonii.AAC.1
MRAGGVAFWATLPGSAGEAPCCRLSSHAVWRMGARLQTESLSPRPPTARQARTPRSSSPRRGRHGI